MSRVERYEVGGGKGRRRLEVEVCLYLNGPHRLLKTRAVRGKQARERGGGGDELEEGK